MMWKIYNYLIKFIPRVSNNININILYPVHNLRFFICIFYLVFNFVAYSQPCTSPAPIYDCYEAINNPYCSINELDGYCGSGNLNCIVNGFWNYLCPGFLLTNTMYFAFIATTTSISVTFSASSNPWDSDCTSALAGIYEAPCPPNGNYILCTQGQQSYPINLTTNLLIPGHIYFLWLTECDVNQICDITIDVISGDPLGNEPIGNISGSKYLCPGSNGNYSIPAVNGALYYYWTLNGSLLNDPKTEDNIIDISFASGGVYQLCVDVANECINVDDPPEKKCIDITVENVVGVDPPDLQTCPGKSISYGGKNYFAGNYDVILKSYKGCDSLVHLTVEELPIPVSDIGTIYKCNSDCLTINDKYGNSKTFCNDVINGQVKLKSWKGCDSLVNFSLKIVRIKPIILKPKDLGCNLNKTDLDGSTTILENIDDYNIKWEAFNGGFLLGNANELNNYTDAAGKYCLTITGIAPDGLVCKDSSCVIVKADPNAPTATIKGDTLTCFKDSILLIGSSNTPGVSFSWLGPDSTIYLGDTISVDTPGVYVLSIKTPTNCVVKSSYTVVLIDSTLAASIQGDTLTCSKPSVLLSGSSNSTNSSFSWLLPDSSIFLGNPISVDTPGNYSFNIISHNKLCTAKADFNVILDPGVNALTALIKGDTINCLKDSIILEGSSNITGSSFDWTGPALFSSSAQNIKVGQTGLYTLTVASSKLCITDTSFNVIALKAIPNVSATGGTIDCLTGQTILKGNSTTPNVTYKWFDSSGNQVATTQNYTATGSGNYTFEVTDPVNGCTNDTTVTALQDINTPNLSISKSGNLNCKVLSVDITANSTTAGVGFKWGDGSSKTMIKTSNPGTYSVTVTNPSNGCKNSTSITIDQDINKPKLSATTDTIKCNNNKTANVDGSSDVTSNITVSWKDPTESILSNTLDFSTSVSQTIKLIVTNNTNGCEDSIYLFIPENITVPSFSLVGDTINCIEPLAVAKSNSQTQNVSFQWTGPAGSGYSSALPNASGISKEGDYTLVVTDKVNGCSDTKSITVFIDVAVPGLNAEGGVLNCANNHQIKLNASSPVLDPNFKWTGPGGFSSGVPDPVVNIAGSYYVSVTDGSNGCIADTSVVVGEDEEYPYLTVNNASIDCINKQVNLIASSPVPGVVYNWNGPGVVNDPNPVITTSIPGDYICIATAPNGCSSTKTAKVSLDAVYPTVLIQTDGALSCIKSSINITTNGSSSGSEYIFTWSGPSGSNPSGSSFNTAVAGTYTLAISNTTNGCKKDTSITIDENKAKPNSITSEKQDPTCFGLKDGKISITGIGGGSPPYQYSLNGGAFTTKTDYTNLAPGTYKLSIKDALGCSYDTTYNLTQPIKLSVDAGRDTIINWGSQVDLNASPNISGNYNVTWQPLLDSSCINCLHQSIILFNNQIFTVTIKDINDCEASDDVIVRVNKTRPVYIPNVFSPNGDGINDIFYIQSKDNIIEEIEDFRIYDRWGEAVFEDKHCPPNDPSCGWNGKYRGKYVNPAVFVYWAKIKYKDGTTELYKGDVTVRH